LKSAWARASCTGHTRGVTPTEIGALFYEKCKAIVRDVEEAENLATLLQSAGAAGSCGSSTSVAFGRRVLVPLALAYHARAPAGLQCGPEL
jgi:DNA-binding transcriptional LysR family regulator